MPFPCQLRRAMPKSAYHRPALAPAPVPSELGPIRRSFPAAWRSRDRSLNPGLERPRFARGLHQTSAPGRKVRPFRLCALAASTVRDPDRCRTNPVAHLVPFLDRAASRRRVDTVPKSPLRRWPFGLCLEGANPRFDVWMMRCRIDSGNCEPADLSTFGSFASGQEWITQRFGAEPGDYPLSRCESSRKRSAFSLMKPAASCWS